MIVKGRILCADITAADGRIQRSNADFFQMFGNNTGWWRV